MSPEELPPSIYSHYKKTKGTGIFSTVKTIIGKDTGFTIIFNNGKKDTWTRTKGYMSDAGQWQSGQWVKKSK